MDSTDISRLSDAVTQADVVEIVRALVQRAKEGDTQAAKILLDRLYGKVTVTQKRASTGTAEARRAKTLKIIERLSSLEVLDAES